MFGIFFLIVVGYRMLFVGVVALSMGLSVIVFLVIGTEVLW